MTRPTTATFDAMPNEMVEYRLSLKGSSIQLFGDGYEKIVSKHNRKMYMIPRMDGYYLIETDFGVARGIAGGNFLIFAKSQAAALLAGEVAVEAVNEIPFVVGGFYSSGSKVGGRVYKEAIATTNDSYCACLSKNNSYRKMPKDIRCVYEVVINGLTLSSIHKAIKKGIEAATKIRDIKMITAGNYGGKLGNIKIPLHSVMEM
jgi:formylmethanofuran--tetrahydromethanopterin N-formyltransferase